MLTFRSLLVLFLCMVTKITGALLSYYFVLQHWLTTDLDLKNAKATGALLQFTDGTSDIIDSVS